MGIERTHWEKEFPRESWFDVRRLEAGVYLISEPGHVNSFLIEGDRSAALLDTGLGVANIRSVAEQLTGLPLLVVNSHYHFDHVGGNQQFDDIAIHRDGAELLRTPAPAGLAAGYMDYTQRLIKNWGSYKRADDLYFHLLTAETLIRPLPDGFEPARYAIVPSHATRLLDDGDVLDLGGRRLQVLHTPGHSPDCICLLDAENGLLFGGDTVNTGPIYAHLPDSNLGAFEASTARLAELRSEVRRVFVCHFMRVENEPDLLTEIAGGFRALLAEGVEFRRNVDCLGNPVREACFDHFSIFTAVESGEMVRE